MRKSRCRAQGGIAAATDAGAAALGGRGPVLAVRKPASRGGRGTSSSTSLPFAEDNLMLSMRS